MDIFKEGKSLNPSIDFSWVSFKVIGDKYQGVYIGTVKNSDSYGNPQTTYLIEQPDKKVLGIGMKDSKTRFHELMGSIKIGQYVGFIYTKDLPIPGRGNAAKIIEIITDSSAVDPNWSGKTGVETTMVETENGGIGHIPENVFDDVTPSAVAPTVSVSDKVKKISDLARAKLNAQNAEEVKVKVKETTGLDFTPESLDNIILQLELL